MRKITMFVLGLLLALPLTVLADSDHNTTGSNTNTNTNTNTATGGAGGAGGQGGTAFGGTGYGGSSESYNSNSNRNTNRNYNSQGQEQGQSQSQRQSNKQGQAQGQSTNNKQTIAPSQGTNVNVDSDVPRQAPPAFAPNLVAAPETCMGSTAIGASTPFGGVSVGSTYKSDDCELRMFARSLQALGQSDAALALLAQNEKVAAALKASGFKAAWFRIEKAIPVAAAARATTTTNFALDRP